MQYKVPCFFKLFFKILNYSILAIALFYHKNAKALKLTKKPQVVDRFLSAC